VPPSLQRADELFTRTAIALRDATPDPFVTLE
jgi:hypothetical protein